MKVRYDAETDILTVIFRDVAVAESKEDRPVSVLGWDLFSAGPVLGGYSGGSSSWDGGASSRWRAKRCGG